MNVWRVMNKRKKQEKRKHASVSSVPDSFSVPSASGSSVSSSQSSTGLHTGGITTGGATGLYHHNAPNSTSLKVQEPPAHHIVHVQTPPRRDSGHSPSHHPNQEVWASKVNGSAPSFTLGTLSPNPHLPKVSVGFADDPLATREDVISITKDVQKFLATISQLKKAMEMMDTSSNTSESNIRILLEDKCSSAEPEDEEIDGVEEGEEEYEEKLKEDKPGDAEDPEVIEVEEEDQVGEKLRQLIEIVEVCLTSNQGMQSTELTRASLNLLKTYKSCTHNNETVSDCPVCNEAIDILVDTFTRCVSDFLTGETSDPASGFAGGSKIRPQALGLQLGKSLQLSKV